MPSPPASTILAFAQTLDGGGVERAMLRLAAEWATRGRAVTLVLGCDAGPLAAQVPTAACTIVLGTRRYRDLAAAVPRIVAAGAPDVIFCPGNHYTAVAAWTRARLGARCPAIVGKLSNALDRPDMPPAARTGYRLWLRAHPRFIDALVAMSPAMAAEAAAHMGLPRDRIAIIANPPPQGSGPRGDAATLPARYLLGVGRLTAQKRWDRAVAALPRLADQAIPLVILGEGAGRDAIAAQAAALGVADRVILPGHVADPLPAMAGAAALVLTSDFEGVPGVLREALSVGTPVVTTESSSAVPELVAHAALGTVVPRHDAEALVAALDNWLRPDRARPAPVTAAGDPAGDYLALFDSLASSS